MNAARPRHLFTARLPDSELGLSLPCRQPPHGVPVGRITLEAAAALYQAERWLPALEDWLGCGLLPRLSSVTEPLAEALMFDQHLRVTHPELDAELHLPWSTLRALRTPPPTQFTHWTWHPLACALVLDALPLGDGDLAGLEAGALLLLPASFAGPWQAGLVPAGGRGEVHPARLYESHGRLCVAAAGEGEAPAIAGDHATVRFRQPLLVPPADLLGWSGAKPAALEAPLLLSAHAMMVHGGAATLANRPLATGQLIPVGAGFALRLDGVPLPAPARTPTPA